MNIKNYTSNVPVGKTVARIEEFIAKACARSISKQYDPEGNISALTFEITAPNGRLVTIRLPADSNAVFDAMMKEYSRPHFDTEARVKEQASRTAWKLMQDWVEVQVSLIRMRQADPVEVFLPYVWDSREQMTVYQKLKCGGFKALPEHCE